MTCLFAQKTTATAGAKTASPEAASGSKSTNKKENNNPPPALPGKLADAINSATNDKSDYVPCFFTRQQLLDLRPQPEAATLSSADAEALRASVIEEALKPENESAFESEKDARNFAEDIGKNDFEGLTHSQTLSKVFSVLDGYAKSPVKSLLEPYAKSTVSENAKAFAKSYAVNTNDEDKVSTAITNAAGMNATAQSKALSDVQTDLTPAGQQELSKATASAAQSNAAKDNLANAARANLALTERPVDIGCSMSILSYETTRKAFGETMADEYIGVQIVVRNVNPDREFLVQSAEFKVDDDINGRLSRYYSGVDKMTAREYMLASRDLGKRNLMVHVVQGTGAILSAAVPFTGPFVKQFSGVYNSGFTSALTTIFPDHNTEQLKLIDDEGFSNSRTDRTVVPKSGTAEFVIFISSKEFEEGWWTQGCAEMERIQHRAGEPGGGSGDSDSRNSDTTAPKTPPRQPTKSPNAQELARCIGAYNLDPLDPKCVPGGPEIGVDLEAAREVCLNEHKSDSSVSYDNGGKIITYFKSKPVSYHHWSQRGLAIFRELSFAVVAGTHVQEESDTKPTVTKIDCQPNVETNGNIDLGDAKEGAIACALTGTNLDKVEQIKLRNSQDATDTTTAEGAVKISGDSKSGQVSFPVAKLCPLTASAYKAYTVTKDGVEGGGDQTLHFDTTTPVLLADPKPSEVDLAALQAPKAQPATIELQGCHLEQVTGIQLSGDLKSPITAKVAGTPTASTATISVGSDDIKDKINVNDYSANKLALTISLLTSTSSKPIPSKPSRSLLGTGNLTKPAAEVPPKPKSAKKKASPAAVGTTGDKSEKP
jgi:hypothetical protein